MIAFIEISEKRRAGVFQRIYSCFRRDYGVEIAVKHFCRMPYLHVKIEDDSKKRNVGELSKSVRKEIHFLADVLRQHNMREVCFPLGFPYRKAVLDERFAEVGLQSLNEAIAGEVALQFAGDGEKTAVIFAAGLSPLCRDAIFAVSTKFRFLLLCLESGGADVHKELQERYGISALLNPSKKRIFDADFALFFDYPTEKIELSPDCTIFSVKSDILESVSGGRAAAVESVLLPERIRKEMPEDFPEQPFLSEAIKCGYIRKNEVHLKAAVLMEEAAVPLTLDNP